MIKIAVRISTACSYFQVRTCFVIPALITTYWNCAKEDYYFLIRRIFEWRMWFCLVSRRKNERLNFSQGKWNNNFPLQPQVLIVVLLSNDSCWQGIRNVWLSLESLALFRISTMFCFHHPALSLHTLIYCTHKISCLNQFCSNLNVHPSM